MKQNANPYNSPLLQKWWYRAIHYVLKFLRCAFGIGALLIMLFIGFVSDPFEGLFVGIGWWIIFLACIAITYFFYWADEKYFKLNPEFWNKDELNHASH